jgi:glycosyltransferase involved in cell wall biosynthesis
MRSRLKVAMVNPSFSYGAGIDRVVYELCEKLKKCCDITVFCADSEIRCDDYKVIKLPSKMVMGDSSFYLSWISRRFVGDYDIIHTHCLTLDFFLYPNNGKKMISTYHGFGPDPPRNQKSILPRWMLKEAILRGSSLLNRNIVAVSNFGASELQKYGTRKVNVIPNGVDSERFLPSSQEDNYILYVGRLVPYKNVDKLLELLTHLKKEHPLLRLKIVGEGWYRKRLEITARKLGVKERVNFVGRIPDMSLVREYQGCIFFVTFSSWEHCGIPVLEANSCGKPVIAPNVGGLPEVIDQGRSGFVINDFEELKKYTRMLLDDESLRKRMGNSARKHAELFDWSIIADKYLEIYKNLVEK